MLLHSAVHLQTASLNDYMQFLPVAVPTITNPLVFTQGSPSSTLTCTSTTSIATTVTFMRNGNAINGIVRDGDSATVNGVTYQLSQTLTNRTQSTYDNVLTITEALSSLAGSTFTCQVENALGPSQTSQSFRILGKTCGLGMYTYRLSIIAYLKVRQIRFVKGKTVLFNCGCIMYNNYCSL